MSLRKIYLDYNATTPVDKDVVKSIHATLNHLWANPSSGYEKGRDAKFAVNEAREHVGHLINAPPNDIYFMSGGTEANTMVIESVLAHFKSKWKPHDKNSSQTKPHIITTSLEHDAIQLPLIRKYTNQIDVSFLEWHNLLETITESIRPSTCLVTVMLANNEAGLLLPIGKLGRLLANVNKQRKADGLFRILLHTDAAQAIGKISVDVQDLQVDYLTIVGHKFYGPRIGALYGRNKVAPLYPIFYGGGQESGLRSGTENTPMIVGLGKAAALVDANLVSYSTSMLTVRDYLEKKLKEKFGNLVKINCIEPCNLDENSTCNEENTSAKLMQSHIERLPNTSSVSFNYKEVTGTQILRLCHSIEASTGSACHSSDGPKSVLEACGVCPFHSKRTIRLSVGRESTLEEMDIAVNEIANAISSIIPIV